MRRLRDDVEALLLLTDVVRQGSFTAAAEATGQTKSTVSKRISRLEDQLGLQLLHRSTRQVSLTSSGMELYRRSEELRTLVEQIEAEMSVQSGEPAGLLRVGAPASFGEQFLPPLVAELQAAHPQLSVHLQLSDQRVDIIEESADVLLRVGGTDQGSLISRRLGSTPWVTVASPAYLARRGTPTHPHDLLRHDGLRYANISAEREWHYVIDGEEGARVVPCRLTVDSGRGLRASALAGLGVGHLPAFYVADDLRTGALVRLLEAFEPPPLPVLALYASRKNQPPALRALLALLHERLPKLLAI